MKGQFLLTLSLFLTYIFTSSQLPVETSETSAAGTSVCRNPLIRKEWRYMSTRQKKEYLTAVQCLGNKPAITTADNPGVVTRYDDFIGVHSSQADFIHFVGHFLPWHRYMVAAYEKALREECGYTGGQPYWDWTIDTATDLPMEQWPLFDNETGFGGNGPYVEVEDPSQYPIQIPYRTGGGCVPAGPFTFDKFQISIGPSSNTSIRNPHCLARDFSEYLARTHCNRSTVEEVVNNPNFGAMARRTEAELNLNISNIHGGGHFAVGGLLGIMGDFYNSPGDPLFYLHHGNLDRIWWNWQEQNLRERLYDVSGPIVPFDYNNTQAGNVTLDFKVNLGKLGKEVTLAQLMNIKGEFLCYDYDG